MHIVSRTRMKRVQDKNINRLWGKQMMISKVLSSMVFILALIITQVGAAGKTNAFTPGSGLRSVGVQIGIAIPSYYDVGFLAGIQADYEVLKMLDICPSFEFVHAGRRYYWGYNNDYSFNEFTLNADLRFYPPLPVSVRPYVGGGFVLVIINRYLQYPQFYDRRDSYNEYGPGFNFLAGVDFPLGTLIPFVQIKGKLGFGIDMLKLSVGLNLAL